MKQSEVKEEIFSKLKIKIEDTLFYVPGETIKGTIELNPSFKINIKNNILHFKLKIFQCEFWEYLNIKEHELKNIYKTIVQTNDIEYVLKENDSKYEENSKIGEFSVIILEKEDNNKLISIPFEIKIDENNDKLLPTFQYEDEKYILGIRHVLIAECKEYNSMNYIGLFIGKTKRKDLDKEIEEIVNFPVIMGGIGLLKAKIVLPKKTFYFGEKVDILIRLNSDTLYFQTIHKTEQIIYRKIEWVGYMKNNLLSKTEINKQESDINESNKNISGVLSLPFTPFITMAFGAIGALGGVFIPFANKLESKIEKNTPINSFDIFTTCLKIPFAVPLFAIGGVGIGLLNQIGLIIELAEGKDLTSKYISLSEGVKDNNEIKKEIEIGKEELRKFIYFKDNQVVGFARFKGNITPPVKGYYFNCYFNYKLKIHLSGVLIDNKKYYKSEIDYYDGEEYIQEMKKLFSVK